MIALRLVQLPFGLGNDIANENICPLQAPSKMLDINFFSLAEMLHVSINTSV